MNATVLHLPADSHHSERRAASSWRARGVCAHFVPAVDTDDSLRTRGRPGPTLRRDRSTHATGVAGATAEAYADHTAGFFTGVGNRPQLAVYLASANWNLRGTPRSRHLRVNAPRNARHVELCT